MDLRIARNICLVWLLPNYYIEGGKQLSGSFDFIWPALRLYSALTIWSLVIWFTGTFKTGSLWNPRLERSFVTSNSLSVDHSYLQNIRIDYWDSTFNFILCFNDLLCTYYITFKLLSKVHMCYKVMQRFG